MATETRPLRADAARNRALLLDAARELFAEKGIGVGLEEIARHAGVGVGTAYRRFPDKEQLIDELFEERLAGIAKLVEAAAAEPDPLAAMRGLVFGLHEHLAVDRTLRVLLLGGADPERFAAVKAQIKPLGSVIVRRAQSAGVVRADVRETDFALFGLMIGTVADATREVHPDTWRRFSELLLRGILTPAAQRDLTTPALSDDEVDLAMRHCV